MMVVLPPFVSVFGPKISVYTPHITVVPELVVVSVAPIIEVVPLMTLEYGAVSNGLLVSVESDRVVGVCATALILRCDSDCKRLWLHGTCQDDSAGC